MVFPGQGSQAVGMQAELAVEFGEIMATYAEASEQLGYDLWNLVQTGTTDQLAETVVTQPAMLTAGVAAWRVWQKAGGPEPQQLAGHSLGEYTALVCAESLAFADAVSLVKRRAELMQAAVPAGKGAMAAILGMDDDAVIDVCNNAAAGQVVSAVNFNSPGQVVIAGDRDAVERATVLAKESGAKRAIILNVSVPSHCALMTGAGDELAESLARTEFAETHMPVISNVDVVPYENPEQIRDGLKRQLFSPVRWVGTVHYLIANGTDQIIECGPGKVLAGLAKRIDRSLAASCIDTPVSLQKILQPDD
jgi:[acyl-carrier-protein] S-malonyltransferase